MQEKLRSRISLKASTQPEESKSEPEVDLLALKRKINKMQKVKCGKKSCRKDYFL